MKISLTKSILSSRGAAEFAKRFLVKSAKVDLSPISMQALLGSYLPMCRYALAFRYQMKSWSTFRRLGGAGYKTAGILPKYLKSRKGRLEAGLLESITFTQCRMVSSW